jgi:hypothetical protein
MTTSSSTDDGVFRHWHEPTAAQIAAGNYAKPSVPVAGMTIRIENPVGSVRRGVDPSGEPWQVRMTYPYGYIVGSLGVDGDPVDCYLGSNLDAPMVYVIHQRKFGQWDEYDEDKAMIGFDSAEDAERTYLLHYNDDRFLGPVSWLPVDMFRDKVLATKDAPAMVKSMPVIDLSDLSCGCANHVLESFAKAMSEDGSIWAAHENPFISKLIELFTERGLLRNDTVKTELNAWMSGEHFSALPAVNGKPGMMPYWTDSELGMVKIYLESIHPSQYTLEDWDYLISYLVRRYLPAGELMSDAEWLATRSFLLGKAQAHLGTISPVTVDMLLATLPTTVAGITYKLSDAAANILSYAKLHACESVVSLSQSAEHALRGVVLNHMSKVVAGDYSATSNVLQQNLFDKFDYMNRDWRRIATTEATEVSGQGVISSLPLGSKVKRMEMYDGACGFCKSIDGMVFTVVSPDKPNKNDWTEMWEGKTNIGRSGSPHKRVDGGLVKRQPHELWFPVPGAVHPHCRGRLQPLEPLRPGDDADFAEWFHQMVAKK